MCVVSALASTVGAGAQSAGNASWAALDKQAEDLYVQGSMRASVATARLALDAASGPLQRGRSLDRLGFLLHQSGELEEGERHLRESLQVNGDAFGDQSLEYAATANDLALLLRDLRRADDAIALATRSVTVRRKRLPATDALLAESLNTLGTAYALAAGDLAGSVRPFEEALHIHEATTPEARSTAEYGTLCVNLAQTYQYLGKYERAVVTLQKGLDALRVVPGTGHPVYALSLSTYATLQAELGHYAEAERLYDEGEKLFTNSLGENHILYASFLNNRGLLYQKMGNLEKAERDYVRAIALKSAIVGRSNLANVATLRNLGELTGRRDPAAAEALLSEAATILAATQTPPPLDQSIVLISLAKAEGRLGTLDRARVHLEQAQAIVQDNFGTHHPVYARALRDRGLLEQASGNGSAAERYLRESLELSEQTNGATHPDLSVVLRALASLYEDRGEFAAALPLYRRSVDIDDGFLGDVLAVGAESFKEETLANFIDSVPALLTFQVKAGARLPEARRLAFEAATGNKGRVLEEIRGWRQRLHDTPSGETSGQLSQWEAIAKCRSSLTVALGYRDLKPSVVGACGLEGTEFEGRYERLLSDLRARWTAGRATEAVAAIAALKARGDALESGIVRALGAPLAPTARTPVADLAARLSADEVLIEYVSYPDSSLTGRRRYGAFVLDSESGLDWIDLSPAGPLEAAVNDLMSAANDWSVSVRNHEPRAARAAEVTADDAMTEIARRAWQPLDALLERRSGIRRLRIAPDGSLNIVPFEALRTSKALIDRFTISYLPAGRDLMRETIAASSNPAVILVSPGPRPRLPAATPPVAQAFRTAVLAPLIEAESEARDLRRLLPKAELLGTGSASEQRLKALRHPSILHIIGHGMVTTETRCASSQCGGSISSLSSHAMSSSAIILEEAYGRASRSTEDGILTPVELQEIDLRGTALVVLSQCQMANGLTSVGEGVYGMRRAVTVAGASSFVAPLWNVEDHVQRTLMEAFYRSLVAGQSRSDALRQAKLQVRKAPATSSFLYWAPVILSGDASPLASIRRSPVR